MDIAILERKENPLLHRDEIKLKVSHLQQPIPQRKDVVMRLSAEVNKEPDTIILRKMNSKFGSSYSIADVFVYESSDYAKRIERPHVLKRHGLVEEDS